MTARRGEGTPPYKAIVEGVVPLAEHGWVSPR